MTREQDVAMAKARMGNADPENGIVWKKMRSEELERWEERQLFLRNEFARELGVHQGRMSIFEEQIKAEESVEEEPNEITEDT